jgi:hypothetical protein
MVGVPEKTFGDWAARFLALGYKVARVDEQESALAKEMREKKANTAPESKIIQRSLAAVYTQGTLMGDFLIGDTSTFIMSIKEDAASRQFGVVFADVATAEFNLCSFTDDAAYTGLETLLVQVRPREIVYERGGLSLAVDKMLRATAAGAVFSPRLPGAEFWDAPTTLDQLELGKYFGEVAGPAASDRRGHWPAEVLAALAQPALLAAFGGLVSYFKCDWDDFILRVESADLIFHVPGRFILIDPRLIGQGTFLRYDPLRHGNSLLLDGQVLICFSIITGRLSFILNCPAIFFPSRRCSTSRCSRTTSIKGPRDPCSTSCATASRLLVRTCMQQSRKKIVISHRRGLTRQATFSQVALPSAAENSRYPKSAARSRRFGSAHTPACNPTGGLSAVPLHSIKILLLTC